ncbi:MAG: 1-acyl-sn-glycerol-3-phosphate acyltransferase [Spirochaetales bacterium]|nr:1-acyl-sn-glycerol-3-phosphate acyltransferase [Leptospiraceae bacterium]MCP5479987.1 1-acyl-sn-glycerol-3-phosphate acyltransferase [Spirochaetales bacterium]MCP5486617.1 1-acyl-sn-glycerol-3-phosphate acyltransferase [Spirochaetales bacterium]
MAEKEAATHAPWQKEFFKNIENFTKLGVSESEAREILVKFLKLSGETPMPEVMQSLRDESALERVGVYTRKDPGIRDFMVQFLAPLLRNAVVEGKENLPEINALMGKAPLVLISNHLSHMDAAAIYYILFREGGEARQLADNLVFIAGRLAFEPDFTRLGLYMIDTLLVCSKRDMSDNPAMADLMTRINMRSFRQSQQLQKEGKVIAIFPEGTRSRTGKLINFVDTVYHYVANKVIIPISVAGTEDILPTNTFLFNAARCKLTIGKPVLVGRATGKVAERLPADLDRLELPETGDKKQFVIDNLALLIGQNLHRHRHGSYRNLYKGDESKTFSNTLIEIPRNPVEEIVVIGDSHYGVSTAAVLANKKVRIQILIGDGETAERYNERRLDDRHYPYFKLPPNITFTADPGVIEGSTILVQAVRPWELDSHYAKLKEVISRSRGPIINVVKGFTGTEHGLILDDLEHTYGISRDRLAVVSGANYPDQIMERKITGFEVAAVRPEMVEHLARLMSTGYVFTRPAINPDDVRGVQLGGALKNIYALGIGLLDGYYEKNLGGNSDNSLFHVSNRIFREMTALGVALGGIASTFEGLSGLTDLMLSCFGQDSRDRQYGHDFAYGLADPEHKSPGLVGIRQLPQLTNLDPEQYPVAAAIHAVLVQGVNFESVINNMTYSLRRF